MVGPAKSDAEPAPDGRLQRSERSRQAIVQALLGLVGEGVLEPTAEQVAARADVGIRTVFRHFSDMESLFAEMSALAVETAQGSSPLLYQGHGVFRVALAQSIRLTFEVEGDETYLTFDDGETIDLADVDIPIQLD